MQERFSPLSLDSWSQTPASDQHEEPTEENEDKSRSPFPVNHKINSQIKLWRGDIWNLEVDVLVNSTTEALKEKSGLAYEIFSRAGPKLLEELISLGGCKTGECKLTGGHNLLAKHVIHTVGPRYQDKYRTAAENALHSCYRGCLEIAVEQNLHSIAFCVINSEKRGYPPELGAHIALRTVRRFLEKFGRPLEHVVFCVQTKDEMNLYEEILPLYFPRNSNEEAQALLRLPEDIGNEIGETTISERVIRIGAAPISSEVGESEIEEKEACKVFTSMQGDVDKKRGSTSTAKAGTERERLYATYLQRAHATDLSDIAQLNVIYQAGSDAFGRTVVAVVGNLLPAQDEKALERVLLYIITVMDAVTNKPFVLVYFHAQATNPEFAWLRKVHDILDTKYGRNLRGFFVVHPTFWLKLLLGVLSPFLSTAFKQNLRFVNSLKELQALVPQARLFIPRHVTHHDHLLFPSSSPSSDSDPSHTSMEDQL
jgi:O-acetyl-ADP-ribose deacetylase (regulator of RNase III)